MPVGLRGLPGLNTLSDAERQAFMLNNEDKLKAFARNPRSRDKAAEILYNNQLFINKFGQEEFDRLNDGTEDLYNLRNQKLREQVVNDTFNEAYEPEFVNGKLNEDTGAGEDWEKIQGLSTDAKEQLLNSEWKTPAQRRQEQKNRDTWYEKAIDFVAGEAIQQYKKESNQKILDRIYNDDADSAASRQATAVSQAYTIPEIVGASDEETRQKFKEAITPSQFNRGIPEYASHWGNGDNPSSEMEDFSIDDMRQVLARKAAYEQNMSPDMAYTALNNEAQRYIKDHQGSMKRFGLFAKDVGISAMSYTADKINGIYNLALAVADATGEKPEVFVDDSGSVLDPNKVKVMQDGNGNLFYQDDNGQAHGVHRERVDRRTLHNMGKNFDGSDSEEGIFHLNPTYWTKAEQFGTLDKDEQKQYEKLGSSPYKVVYDPNDDRDLVYESFKMMSFGLADAASMLIPFGVGLGGRVLSTASNVGKVGRGLGKALDTTGKYLSAQSRVGQVTQGLAGAGGIAYAYQRGAFQETLAQNMANLEEANLNKSKQEVFDRYNTDEQYKAQVDAMVAQRAAQMKQEYLAQNAQEGNQAIVDEKALDEMLMARASDIIHNELVSQKVQENKNGAEYAALQQEAIQSAGDAAWTSFWPEAIKYGLVNTVGYRKFLYTNPSGLKKPISKAMKGMKEVTTKEGRQRLAVEAANGSNWKNFGKVVGKQFWGGAWTNGTDDMMVDAAERINEDSFNRYLNAYENGEALADEYGLIDGIYSYWKGLNNSMGQETTREAAAVGGFGSLVSASPNMANIAHLATREGRDAFKNNFQKRIVYETDENGFKKIKRDENGKPVTEDVDWKDNWRERASFFIQNGVLNTYYGARQNERDLQNHADYVNEILDRYEDFSALKNLIASDIERQNVEDPRIGDEKTMRFVHAFNAIDALEQLSQDKNDALKFSSVIDNAKSLIESASKIGTNENNLSEDQVSQLVSEYYSHNPEIAESEENNQVALNHIAQNAKKMMEAYDAYNEAKEHIINYEKDKGITIVPSVKNKLILHKALVGHWKDRLSTMEQEIGATTNTSARPTDETLIAAVGGKKRASEFIKAYNDTEQGRIKNFLNPAIAFVQKKLEAYNKAQQTLREAESSEDRYAAEQAVNTAKVEYELAVERRNLEEDILENIRTKKAELEKALKTTEADGTKARVLTTNEIMALDPALRAQMMDPETRPLYSRKQQNEIAKLESQLKQRDTNGDPIQKLQDIANLTRNIRRSEDAYNRLSRNPDAAALEMELQTVEEAEKAYNIINERNAQTLANSVQDIDDALKVNRTKKSDRDAMVYRMLRKHSNTLLDIIDRNGMLPDHQTQIDKAKEWSKVLTDIDAVVNSLNETDEWKKDVNKNIDAVIDVANSRQEIIDRLEEVIDTPLPSAPNATQDFEKVLNGLAQIGYSRDTTVLENRKQRLEREEKIRQEREKAQKEAEEAAKKAMEEAAKTPVVTDEDKKDTKGGQMSKKDMSSVENIVWDEDEEKEPDVPKVSITPAMLMDDDVEDGSIDAGEMWTDASTPQRGILSIKRETSGKTPTVTFSIDSNATTLQVTPNEYVQTNGNSDVEAESQNLPFNVKSIKQINGEWYFEGNFAGQSDNNVVKVSDSFDLDEAINREKEQRETNAISSDVNMSDNTLIDDGEQVSAISESLEQQAEPGQEIIELDTTDDAEELNKQGQQSAEDSTVTLSGTAMPEFDLVNSKDFVFARKVGKDKNDSRSHFNAWMKENGINYQTIINKELPLILKNDPQTKIKFMAMKPEAMGTKVGDTTVNTKNNISRHLFLVVDYDSNVKNIHNENNGGVMTANGKKYLLVGVVGYGDAEAADAETRNYNLARRDYYNTIINYDNGRLKNNQYYVEHPEETCRVLEDVYTEIVPGSMIPGWIVKEIVGEIAPAHRPVSEILQMDNEREGTSLTLDDLKWGIQEYSQFLGIKEEGKNIHKPSNVEKNAGAAFVLIPAGSGKYVTSHIDARKYSELRGDENDPSTLKFRINRLLGDTALLAPGKDNYPVRLKAAKDLAQIFYLSKNGNNILVGKNKPGFENKITLINDKGDIVYSEFITADFDREAFLEAFRNKFNPRINITPKVLRNTAKLIELDEAGALDTDVVTLHTESVMYSIYPIDSSGRIIKPESIHNAYTPSTGQGTFRTDRNIVWYGGLSYEYKPDSRSYVYGTETITEDSNPSVYKALEFNRSIILGKLAPNYHKNSYDYFVMKEDEHPVVVKADVHHKLTELSEKESQRIIDQIKQEEERKKRAEEAQKELDQQKSQEKAQKVDIPLTTEEEEGDFVVDESTGLVVPKGITSAPETQQTQQDSLQEEKKEMSESKPEVKDPVSESKKADDASKPKDDAETQTFEALIKKKKYKERIYTLILEKWPDMVEGHPELTIDLDHSVVPSNENLREFLQKKGVPLDSISTTEDGIKAWIETFLVCRK